MGMFIMLTAKPPTRFFPHERTNDMTADEPLIPKHGGYRKLKSFQVAQLVFDITVRFCDRYIEKRSRTHDQMVQAARSGVQNIAEGSQASGTSKKTELKLTNVARASLEELRLDYEDFLRQRGLPLWDRDDPRRQSLIDAGAPPPMKWLSGCGKSTIMDRVDKVDRRSRPLLLTPNSPPMPRLCCRRSRAACLTASPLLRRQPLKLRVALPNACTGCVPKNAHRALRPLGLPSPPRPLPNKEPDLRLHGRGKLHR
jgi:four helix bundle protein